MTADGNPLRAGRYARISYDKAGDEHGVANQLADQARLAEIRGFTITRTESDNDISALTGKHRPGYEALMAAVRRGEIDVILVFQTSRFWRNRSERAAGIEILRKAGVSLIATKGPSLDMSTAYGRAMAGLLGEFDTMESEVKAERQQLANSEDAKAGKPRKGMPRPFGWQAGRAAADPAEAAAVLDGSRAILTGGTITGVAREWDRRGLRPHQAPFGPLREHPWTCASVRQILRNPRNAGISTYYGDEVGQGTWEPLVPEETWRAVVAVLGDKGRKPTQGVRTMLGGIGLCRCGNYIVGSHSANGRPSYRCNQDSRNGRPGPHVGVIAAGVDEHVGALVVARLSEPGAAGLLAPAAGDGNAGALHDEAVSLRARLARLGELYMDGKITEQDMVSGRGRGEQRLAEVEEQLAGLGRESVLAPLIAARNIAAAWEGLGTDRRRAVVDALMTVTLYPSGRGARKFDPGKVLPPGRGIVWKGGTE